MHKAFIPFFMLSTCLMAEPDHQASDPATEADGERPTSGDVLTHKDSPKSQNKLLEDILRALREIDTGQSRATGEVEVSE